MPSVSFDSLSGSTRLFLDFICCSNTAFKYYKYDFRSMPSYINAAEWIDRSVYDREKLVAIISDSIAPLNLPDNIKNNIEKLSQPDSLAVFAGQQVGLFWGPMYTVIKALASYKMANKLETLLNRPVVPCFWMATDDHDFDEIKTVNLLDRSGDCHEFSYEPSSLDSDIPMTDVTLDDEIEKLQSSLSEHFIETEFTPSIIDVLKKRYKSGASVSQAFAGLFGDFLGDFGIIPVDPNYPGMKTLFAPVFRREIENYDKIFDLYETASQELLNAGYHRQVHKSGESLNLFFNENGRANIVHKNGEFHLEGKNRSFTKEQLLEKLESEPERFSPNVCLRPVAQCYAFPTICQIVGPSEAAYYAQIRPIFKYLNVPWPVIKPRMFITIVEPHIKKIMEKLKIDFSSLYNETDRELSRVIKENFPSEIESEAESVREKIKEPLKELSRSLKDKDPESFQVVEQSLKRLDLELNHLYKKLFTAHKKRHDTAIGQVKRAANFLFPQGKFQERVISPVYFANKFGPDVFKRLEEKSDIDSVDHQLVEL
ncbi:MAG: bacillithiol biosynthesis cysteine-adding enzyme BshC [Candidatus Zixiibacteriota bacterium]|nr:MAG: bacillithiol biosynthesis cysteine-adding enzyme BshC [candidate division Zixibacteria bacterium]